MACKRQLGEFWVDLIAGGGRDQVQTPASFEVGPPLDSTLR